jgi:hypothetical protein
VNPDPGAERGPISGAVDSDNPASLHGIKAPGFDDVEIHHAGVTRLFWASVSTYLHAWTLKRSQV